MSSLTIECLGCKSTVRLPLAGGRSSYATLKTEKGVVEVVARKGEGDMKNVYPRLTPSRHLFAADVCLERVLTSGAPLLCSTLSERLNNRWICPGRKGDGGGVGEGMPCYFRLIRVHWAKEEGSVV